MLGGLSAVSRYDSDLKPQIGYNDDLASGESDDEQSNDQIESTRGGQDAPAKAPAVPTAASCSQGLVPASTEIEFSVSRPSAAAPFGFSMTFTPTGAVITNVDPAGLVAQGSSGKVRPGLLLLKVDGVDVTSADRSQLQAILKAAGGPRSPSPSAAAAGAGVDQPPPSAFQNTTSPGKRTRGGTGDHGVGDVDARPPLLDGAGAAKCEVGFTFVPSGYSMVFSKGATPVAAAAKRGLDGIVRCLAEHGADLNVADADGRHPIHYYVRSGACSNAESFRPGAAAIVRLLIQNGADVNVPLQLLDEVPVGSKPAGRLGIDTSGVPPRLYVTGASGNPTATACNGTYTTAGDRNGMPLYRKVNGTAVMYWDPKKSPASPSRNPREAEIGNWKMYPPP